MFKWIKKLIKHPLSPEQIDSLANARADIEFEKLLVESKPEPAKPGPDLIARQGGQKRNRYHIYIQPWGKPIRLCDWVSVPREQLEDISESIGAVKKIFESYYCFGKTTGCSHCLAIARGERQHTEGERNHGRGIGAK